MAALIVAGATQPTRRRAPIRVSRLVTYGVLIVGAVLMLLPFIWMLLGSFKDNAEIIANSTAWLPQVWTFENYARLIGGLNFTTAFANSVIVAGACVLGNLVFCSMAGYALAKIDFAGRNALFVLVLGMLMIPAIATFVPLFVLVTNLGLSNSLPGMILPYLVTPLGVFLMRQFIGELPDSLLEAARLDGAGEWRIFAQIVLPLSKPPLATLAILTFLAQWNNFLWPLVVAQTEDRYTLPVALALYSVGQNGTNYGLLLAGAVIVVVPILALFLFLQRQFIEGVASTGIK
ncbi:sugar ABC transporter permease [Agromyces luteolus]|uniref:ABC transporter permease subunit n=1 Tax=Agromyces luteolus TaxID=88373 RepID=A0A7C9LF69_9MICO|nr:carbohydrate ABC transporter permease [Agromyces luteolus]MUN08631.1 ABC transporter permease subunit [Agromyces luteolus]GLK27171.1 sugar ABC transporter permease [Agromyces luteolus]